MLVEMGTGGLHILNLFLLKILILLLKLNLSSFIWFFYVNIFAMSKFKESWTEHVWLMWKGYKMYEPIPCSEVALRFMQYSKEARETE